MSLQGYVGSSQDQTRIRRQEKQREEEKRQIEELKRETEAKSIAAGLRRFGTGTAEVLETAFKNETVGLVTREEFLKKKTNLEERFEGQEKKEKRGVESAKRKQKRPKHPIRAVLSFGDEEEEAVTEGPDSKVSKKKESDRKERRTSKYGKCPSVETEFLPDAERDRREKELREQLKREWKERQEAIKEEDLELVYSYWDGTGHRRTLKVKKGDTIGDFLRQARDQLSKDFRELRLASVENLLYIKEDLMIPHNLTFYDLMLCRMRGSRTALFDFGIGDDVLSLDGTERWTAKVVERHWYDRNKHIFPASRWEVYDPDKNQA